MSCPRPAAVRRTAMTPKTNRTSAELHTMTLWRMAGPWTLPRLLPMASAAMAMAPVSTASAPVMLAGVCDDFHCISVEVAMPSSSWAKRAKPDHEEAAAATVHSDVAQEVTARPESPAHAREADKGSGWVVRLKLRCRVMWSSSWDHARPGDSSSRYFHRSAKPSTPVYPASTSQLTAPRVWPERNSSPRKA